MISAWLLSLWAASVRGGAALIVAWVLCHVPRVPAAVRCWIWRAAYAVLLISLVWTKPVNLPLLRPPVVYQAPNPIQVVDPIPSAILPIAPIASPRHQSIATPWYSAWPTIFFSLWVIFLLVYAVRLTTGWMKARRLRDGPLVELPELMELCRAMNIRHPPAVRIHPAVPGPLLVGVRKPVIVLPESMVRSDHLQMILAHELAHLQRLDLLWNWLPTLAMAVLPVHPLVWICNRQWRLSTEAACDAAAMETTNVNPADYGRILVNVATTFPPRTLGVLAVAAVAESRWLLKQRLAAMANITHWNRRRSMIAGLTVGFFAMAAVVPWRVVAQEPAAPTTRPIAAVDALKPAKSPAPKIQSFQVMGTIVIPTNSLRASVSGTVTKVPITVGQTVKHGEVLIQLDPTLAQAEVDQASAKNDYAEKDTANAEKLALSNTVSAAEVDLKKAQLQLSRAELKRAQYNLDATRIVAPFDGTVAQCDVQVGDVVDSHQSMATVLQDGPPRVEFNVTRGLAGRIPVGTPVTVEVIGGASTFKGAVSVVSPVFDAGSQTQRLTAQLVDGRPELLAGMLVNMTVDPQ